MARHFIFGHDGAEVIFIPMPIKASTSTLQSITVWIVAVYVLWVLTSLVAWVGHLGDDAKDMGVGLPFLLASASPTESSRVQPAASLVEFVWRNAPLGLLFVFQHSCLHIKRLEGFGARIGANGPSPGVSRLIYNLLSAVTLHIFLHMYTPFPNTVVVSLPISAACHFFVGSIALLFAMACFCASPQTWALLGVAQCLGWNQREGGRKFSLPGNRMDAITFMGKLVWKAGGAGAFIMFSGLSIIPRHCTTADVMIRVCAAVYIRQFSVSFRLWVKQIEQTHLFTWGIRSALVLYSFNFRHTISSSFDGHFSTDNSSSDAGAKHLSEQLSSSFWSQPVHQVAALICCAATMYMLYRIEHGTGASPS
jgi:hypothetical protein